MPGSEPASDVRRVAASTLYGLAGRGTVLLLGLVSVAITTRYLGPDLYGRFALALSFVQLFGVLADAGLTTIVVRELAQKPERAASVLGSALALRSGLAIAAAAAAALAALLMPYPPDVRVAVLIAGVPLVLGLLNSAFVAVLQADLRAGRIAIADVAGRAAALAAVAVVVGARPRLLRRRGRRGRGRGGDAGADLGARAAAAPRAAARRPGDDARARRRRAPARRGARAQRGLLPRRRADHLALAPVRGARPVRAGVAGQRAHRDPARRLPRVGVPAALGLRRALGRAHADRAAHRRRRDDLRGHGRRGGRRAGGARARPRARRRRLRGRRDAAADPALSPPRSGSSTASTATP